MRPARRVWVLYATAAGASVLLGLGACAPAAAGRGAGAAGGAALPEAAQLLPDPAYAEAGSAADPAPRRIGRLAHPTVGFPALAAWGGRIELVVRTADPGAGRPESWRAAIRQVPGEAGANADRAGPRYALRIVEARAEPPAGTIRLLAEVPAAAPRDSYDLELDGPGGLHEVQRRAVRLYGRLGESFRVVLMADHQLWDPSWKESPGAPRAAAFPARGERDRNRAMERQVRHEIALLDPDLVLDAGDLLFGLDYGAEVDEMAALLGGQGLAGFAVPGNHDAYAIYELHLRGGPVAAARVALVCRTEVQAALGEGTWRRAAAAMVCLYGNLKPLLFQTLARDAAVGWRRSFGPLYYAFDHGPYHFVALDTYDGSPERRHAFSLFLDAFDLHLGAPAVDNYGGYLSDAQLDWLERDLAHAAGQGRTIVLFGHHDPRGNLDAPPEERYAPNLPFPTDPLSLSGFKEWQYDSDFGDRAGRESRERNSGTRLLGLCARYASAYLSGHVHRDAETVYEPGQEIAPGIRAERRIAFVRTTSASSSVSNERSYWGYRLLEARGGALLFAPWEGAGGLASVPAGNLWLEAAGPTEKTVVSALGRSVAVRLRFFLPDRAEGYRFEVGGGARGRAALVDVGEGGFYGVRVEVPAAERDGASGRPKERRVRVPARGATGNRPPAVAADLRPAAGGRDEPTVGWPVTLSAARSSDPDDGDGIVDFLWTLPDGSSARGPEVVFTPAAPGAQVARVVALDRQGARAAASLAIEARPPPAGLAPPGRPGAPSVPHGCGCQIGSAQADRGRTGAILSLALGLGVASVARTAVRRKWRRGMRLASIPLESGGRRRFGTLWRKERLVRMRLGFGIVLGAMLCGGCGSTRLIPNTHVPDNPENREVIDVCERYRRALEARDSVTLMALASPRYWEDSGTPKPDDDYGYDGLRHVIADRLSRLRSVRYEMEYRNVRIRGPRAEVEVYIDASFQIQTAGGDQYRHFTEYNKLELENDGKRWLFTRGM